MMLKTALPHRFFHFRLVLTSCFILLCIRQSCEKGKNKIFFPKHLGEKKKKKKKKVYTQHHHAAKNLIVFCCCCFVFFNTLIKGHSEKRKKKNNQTKQKRSTADFLHSNSKHYSAVVPQLLI